jgi:epoxide hydrolase-like predicted phosphatase
MAIALNKYKNIIFDLGGVILNIDYLLTAKAFAGLGVTAFDELFSQAKQKELFDVYEKGQISSEEFREEVKKYCKNSPDDKTLDAAWNAILLDLPKARLELLQKIKATHRTFLLSNTNDIHIVAVNNYLQETFGISDLSGYFENTYLSYKVGMRKPDAEIFNLVLEENSLNLHETLFIDDSIQHIESAKNLGIQTYWLDVKKESILEVFNV